MRRDFCRTPFEARHLDYTSRYSKAWFLLLEQRREPAGRLYIDLTGPSLHLIDIALLPAFQGRGIGIGILRALPGPGAGGGQAPVAACPARQ